jgi:hypothetical protein
MHQCVVPLTQILLTRSKYCPFGQFWHEFVSRSKYCGRIQVIHVEPFQNELIGH